MTDTFTLNTSGEVWLREHPGSPADRPYRWSDLSPFAQGYVTAMFDDLLSGFSHYERRTSLAGFSDLSPEALEAILRDCEDARTHWCMSVNTADAGRSFWEHRQNPGHWRSTIFPPLSTALGEDGRVYLRSGE